MRTRLLFISFLLVVNHSFYGQTLQARYRVEQKKEMLTYDRDTVSEMFDEITQHLNDRYREILNIVEVKVVSSGEIYQVSMLNEDPTSFDFTRQFNLAKYGLIGWDIIHADLKSGVAFGIMENPEEPIRAVETKNIIWKLTGESKIVHGLKVVKAIGEIVNVQDEYPMRQPLICWFAPEIEFHCGPTEYANLKGLIVEIEYPRFNLVLDSYEMGDFSLTPIELVESKVMNHQEYNSYQLNIAKSKYPRPKN